MSFRRLTLWEWTAAAALGALLAALALFPALDLRASRAFYDPAWGFSWHNNLLALFVKEQVPRLIVGSLVGCVVLWLAGFWRARHWLRFTTRQIVFLIATLVVGPGLIVETFIKPHSGRARPEDITMFGGTHAYTLPLSHADACANNCSFVSGHAAVTFWLTAYAFVVPPGWRRLWLGAGIAAGLLMGLVRMMQGAHFLSDIVYAGCIVIAVNVMLARLILEAEVPKAHDIPLQAE
jgi:lipid A 4'-phosphatase